MLEQALKLDSLFVAAWVEMAGLYATLASNGLIPIKDGNTISKGLIDKAPALLAKANRCIPNSFSYSTAPKH
ncbi:MAG: hypothetical protein OEU84_15035 [Xanthomonadales bacterium]|nr:hypothetical protein [Xanthomonadales bacterium]